MAKKDDKKDGAVEVFVLRDCQFGKATEVVELDPVVAEVATAQGMVDSSPGAVEHGKSLKAG